MSTTWGIGTPRRCQPYTMPSPIAPGGRQAPRDARARLGRTSGAFQVYGTRRRPDDAAHKSSSTLLIEPAPGAERWGGVIVIRHLSLPGHARARAPSRVPFGHFRVARPGTAPLPPPLEASCRRGRRPCPPPPSPSPPSRPSPRPISRRDGEASSSVTPSSDLAARLLASSLLGTSPPPPVAAFFDRSSGARQNPRARSRRAFPTRTASSPAWGRACPSGRRCGCGSTRRSGCGRSTRPRRRRCASAVVSATRCFWTCASSPTTRSGPSRAPSTSPTSPAASSPRCASRVQEEERRLRLPGGATCARQEHRDRPRVHLGRFSGQGTAEEPRVDGRHQGRGVLAGGVRAVSGGVPEPVPPARRREPVLPGLRVRRELAGGEGTWPGTWSGSGTGSSWGKTGSRDRETTERSRVGHRKRSERDPRTQDAAFPSAVTLKFFKLAGEAVALIDDRPARAAVGHTVGRLLARGFFSAARLR